MSFFILAWLLAAPARADSFPSWFAKAQKAEARKDDETALQAWSNALYLWKETDSKPKKAQALAARAALHQKKGEWEAALRDLSGAIRIETKDARLFHRRGALQLEHGKAAEAISDFYKATALKPDFAEAFYDRGRAYELQDDADFAREDFKTACHMGFKKACEKVKPSKDAPKKPAPAAAPQTPAAPKPKPAPAAAAKSTGAAEIAVGSVVEEIPVGDSPGGEEAPPEETVFDPRACIGRIRSCADNGNSYSACVSRARLCEDDPRQGCCPRECVVLFQSRANSRSEAAAFREVFRLKNPCLAPRPTAAGAIIEESVP
ncbi:MAG: hypothetical protein HY926_00725 [Elusimicrobia bacterium]|nr:hypothetical protein [Elusimicrobiota bacterium]